jgi:ribose transport system ATP-binding protein
MNGHRGLPRALSHNVRLLIMDEPSSILDDGEVEVLFGVVRRLTAEGVGVVYISHRLDEIPRIGSRVTVLSDGRTVATGLPADTPSGQLVEKMVGRKIEQLFPARPKASGDVLLSVSGVTRAPDVRDVSFEARAGEVLGIGGLVGAGRTELLRLIYGLDPRDGGEVLLEASRCRPAGRARRSAPGWGSRREDGKSQGLLLDWSLAKNVTLADLGQFRRGGLISLRDEKEAAAKQLRALGTVPDDANRLARELSGGNQQKVVLSRWLLHECRVLMLDEPTRGVDVGSRTEIYKLIAELAGRGLGVVVESSEFEELLGIATRILVMREGAVVAELEGESATELELLHHAVAPTEEVAA